jgi:hypothetical protein
MVAATITTVIQVFTPLALFTTSHIGLSNVREPIINAFGSAVNKIGLVGLEVPTGFPAAMQPDEGVWFPTEQVKSPCFCVVVRIDCATILR